MLASAAPFFRKALLAIRPELLILFTFDMLVAVGYVYWGWTWIASPHIPLSIFGGALGAIVGFRNNSSYQRWWEARTLWGSITNYSRTLARQALTFIQATPEESEIANEMKHKIVFHQIAYVHALRRQLRGQDPLEELTGLLAPDEIASLKGLGNVALEIQTRIGLLFSECFRRAWIDSIRWSAAEASLAALANAQGGAERIKNTPMPKQYDSLPRLFVSIYCVLLPLGMVANLKLLTPIGSSLVGFIFLALDKTGRELETPFENTIHDVPLTSITRTIEMNLRQQLKMAAVAEPGAIADQVFW
jgi:putative membrane protein